MTRSGTLLGIAAAAVCGFGASAQITSIPAFTGTFQEGFETQALGQFVPQLTCFGGNAVANQVGGSQGLHVTTGWGYYSSIQPHGGSRFMGGTSQVTVEWVFNPPAKRFGGYFGTNFNQPGATATFYDSTGAVMSTQTVACPMGGVWEWSGWEATGTPISRVQITGSNPTSGHIMHDDLELTPDAGCYPDCNNSGNLTIADFACFQAAFASNLPYADCNNSGTLTIADFACFQAAFATGCP